MITTKIQPMLKGRTNYDDPHFLILREEGIPAMVLNFPSRWEAEMAAERMQVAENVEAENASSNT